ncbi:MAG TPA: EamA family transporter [Microvirga sp.]|jgi:drug/metabolite transporter (DMT)-like permease|nr:EamA family transporter [Microvirga sp.]
MGPREWAMLVVLSVVWGGSFFFVGVAVKEWPPLTIAGLRVALAALALHAVLRVTGTPLPRERAVWRAFFGMGLLNNAIPFSLMVWGQGHIASGLAAILNAATPLFTVLVAHAFTRDERLTGLRLSGVLVGFAGVAVMIGADALASLGVHVLAQLAVLLGTVSYAFAGVYGRRFRALGVQPLVTATGQVTASSLVLLPLALVVEQPWRMGVPSGATIAAILALALVSTAFAYILYFRILARAGATNVILVTFLIPVSAILLGATVLSERLEPRHFAGMALIGIGLAFIDGRLVRALNPARPKASSGSG